MTVKTNCPDKDNMADKSWGDTLTQTLRSATQWFTLIQRLYRTTCNVPTI